MLMFETREQLAAYIRKETVNTAEAAEILGCTRQNIAKLVNGGKLVPIKVMQKDRLFWREDVLARKK